MNCKKFSICKSPWTSLCIAFPQTDPPFPFPVFSLETRWSILCPEANLQVPYGQAIPIGYCSYASSQLAVHLNLHFPQVPMAWSCCRTGFFLHFVTVTTARCCWPSRAEQANGQDKISCKSDVIVSRSVFLQIPQRCCTPQRDREADKAGLL